MILEQERIQTLQLAVHHVASRLALGFWRDSTRRKRQNRPREKQQQVDTEQVDVFVCMSFEGISPLVYIWDTRRHTSQVVGSYFDTSYACQGASG